MPTSDATAALDSSTPHDTPIPGDNGDLPRPVIRVALGGALAAGLTADLLIRPNGPGINLAAWLLVATGGLALLHERRLGEVPRDARPLLLITVLFACLLAVRNADLVSFGNVVAAVSALALAAATARADAHFDVTRTRVRDVARQLAGTAVDAALSALPFVLTQAPRAMALPSRHRHASLLLLRAGIASVLVAGTFALLLVNGDPVFGELVRRLSIPVPDLNTILTHLIVTTVFGWPVLGLLAGSASPAPPARPLAFSWGSLSRLDVLAILGGVNGLFALYLAVQLRVLFGGLAYVQATTHLTLAEYARSGFFTLLAVGALALGGLLGMHATRRDDSPGIVPTFRRLATVTMVLVSLVMASAVVRMSLYVQEYGLTVDRLYTFAAMCWIAAVFLWLRFTMLGARPLAFVRGALYAGWGTLLGINLLNPEALAVRVNAQRAAAGHPFDLEYAVRRLRADAVPPLVEALVGSRAIADAQLVASEKSPACRQVQELLDRWGADAPDRHDGWSVGIAQARSAVRDREAALRARACAPARR